MSKQVFKPLSNKIVVKRDKAEEKTQGGLYVPDTAQKKENKGTVIAVGPGKKDSPMEAKPGDRILFSSFSGTEIQGDDGETYLVMQEDEILTTFTTEEE